ncbi:MAG: tRNA preQ1(34) S-adenosylmethionine ribosyltransferase-isomerase QueA [Prevotellaceae bacterium]|jgi:S-adenosylmethionine:tRNA ribosyltransferase-isomerase|nr:tRNA preQ1(34) S-adenosylmethionine ribosyltransferase-isomerase QueA [Prevotellaceae bacterium]
MKLSQFKFKLPEELVVQYPAKNRDEARLLVVHKKTGEIEHKIVANIIDYFGPDDLFVFNNTQVFPALLDGKKEKTESSIEVFLLRELNPDLRLWDVLVEPARKIRVGNKLYFGPDDSLVAEVIDNTTSRGRTIRFLFDGTHEEFKQVLFSYGRIPLPPYVKRPTEPDDEERFQTIFAAKEGAVVAPFAGLHFSKELMKRMTIRGINFGYITLHCSLSIFRTIDVEDLVKHKMDSEQMDVNEEFVELYNKTLDAGKKICTVGTSSFRALETAATVNGRIKPYGGWTNKFIFPPYSLQTADNLMTNFHAPLSSMLMNVATFGGYEIVMRAYQEAIKEGYRFGCYGDAMLILKN